MTTTPVSPRRGRRSQHGGIVTERLQGLKEEMQRESLPGQLREAAATLSEALKAKTERHPPRRRDDASQPRV